ncbi:MAG: hypothetical protein LCH44_10570 [Bacteroidetes bacterium]|jgi:hypothetical protein|nr:hypothetical protein [Bacteroidota bacterium]
MSTTETTKQRWDWKDNPDVVMPPKIIIYRNLKNMILSNEEVSNFAVLCIICFVSNYKQLYSHVMQFNKHHLSQMKFPLPNNLKTMLGSSHLIVDGTGEKIEVYI